MSEYWPMIEVLRRIRNGHAKMMAELDVLIAGLVERETHAFQLDPKKKRPECKICKVYEEFHA